MYVMLTLCSMHSGRGHWAAGRGGYLVTLVKIEISLSHTNNFSSYTFSSYTLKHVWWKEFDFSVIFLSFCPSTHKERIFWIDQSIFALFFSQNFRIIFRIFSQNFHIIFRIFRETFAFSLFYFSRNRLKRNFAKKTKIFAFFARKRNAKKLEHFRERFFLFAANPNPNRWTTLSK